MTIINFIFQSLNRYTNYTVKLTITNIDGHPQMLTIFMRCHMYNFIALRPPNDYHPYNRIWHFCDMPQELDNVQK